MNWALEMTLGCARQHRVSDVRGRIYGSLVARFRARKAATIKYLDLISESRSLPLTGPQDLFRLQRHMSAAKGRHNSRRVIVRRPIRRYLSRKYETADGAGHRLAAVHWMYDGWPAV